MPIPSKQIGWSQESNLIWEVLKQLNKLTNVTATSGGGGGGGTNPTSTIIPYNNAGTFADSYLKNDTTNSLLKTVYSTSDIGLKLDFANDVYSIGDYAGVGYKTSLTVNNNTQSIYLDSQSVVEIGDRSDFNNGTKLIVSDQTQTIKTSNQGNDAGLTLDFGNSSFVFGDYNIIDNGCRIEIGTDLITLFSASSGNDIQLILDDSNALFNTKFGGSDVGLKLDFSNSTFSLGDHNNVVNGTKLVIDDTNRIIKTQGLTDYGIFEHGLVADFANSEFTLGDVDRYGVKIGFYTTGLLSQIGDYNSTNNATYLEVDDNNSSIKSYNSNIEYGLFLDYNNQVFILGDYATQVNSTSIFVDDANQLITAAVSERGLTISPSMVSIGDYSANFNLTTFTIDDGNTTITWKSSTFPYFDDNGTGSMQSATAGSANGYFVVNINGNDYKIPLYDPS